MGAFDDLPAKGAKPIGGGAFDDLPEAAGSGGLRRYVADPALSLLKGAVGIPEAGVGLADIVSGGEAGKALEEIGLRPKDAKAYLDTFLSPEQQAVNKTLAETKGFLPTIATAIENPSTIAHAALESLPSMGAGGVLARGALKVAPKLPALYAGAFGEGAVSAGSTAEQIRQATADGLLTPEQAAIAAGSGALTGAFNVLGAKIGEKFGVTDIDTLLARGLRKDAAAAPAKAAPGIVKRVAGGAFSEGVLEELPQSSQEQIAQNLALGKPWDEGVPEAAAMGMLVGGMMGAGAGVVKPGDPAPPAPKPDQEAPPVRTEHDATLRGVARKVEDSLFANGEQDPAAPSPEERAAAQAGATQQMDAQRQAAEQRARDEAAAAEPPAMRQQREARELAALKGVKDGTLTPEDGQYLVEAGLARPKKDGGLTLLPAGRRRWKELEDGQAPASEAPAEAPADPADVKVRGTPVADMDDAALAEAAENHPMSAQREAARAEIERRTPKAEGADSTAQQQEPGAAPVSAATAAAPAQETSIAAGKPEPAGFKPAGERIGALPEWAPVPTGWRKKWYAHEVAPGKWRMLGVKNSNPISPSFPTEAEAEAWADAESAAAAQAQSQPAPVDEAAHQAATSPKNDLPQPTEAQKEAGNYAKGHARVAGMDLSIENPAGSKRRPEWPTLQQHYGYVKGSVGMDKDHVDVFVRPGTPPDWKGTVYVVNQKKGDGKPDEHKAMIGFDSLGAARAAYLENYTAGWEKNVDSVVPIRSDKFAAWTADKSKAGPAGGFLKSGSPGVQILGQSVHRMRDKALKAIEGPLQRKANAGERLTPKQREQLDAAREELDRRAEERAAKPMSPAETARREKLKRDAAARKQIDIEKDSLIPAIIKLGGLNVSQRMDIIRDDTGNRGIPGVGMLFTRAGMEADGMATELAQYGYLTDAEMADVDGGVGALQEKVSEEFDGQRTHWSVNAEAPMRERMERDAEAAQDQADAEAAQAAAEGVELNLNIDPMELADEEIRDDAQDLARAELGARAEKLEEGVLERLSMQHDTDDAYWRAVAEFVKERENAALRANPQADGVRQEEGEGSGVPEGDRAPAQAGAEGEAKPAEVGSFIGVQPDGARVYHVSPASNRASIERGGLRGNAMANIVWLSPSLEESRGAAQRLGGLDIWQVDAGGLALRADPLHPELETSRSAFGPIPADRLTLLSADRPALDLQQQTEADLDAKDARAADEKAAGRAIADRERDLFQLQPQASAAETQDTTGDMFGATGAAQQPKKRADVPAGTGGGLFAAPQAATFGEKNTVFTKSAADAAREILRKKLGGGTLRSGIDPEIMQAGIQLAGYYIEGGARSFRDYSAKMIEDLGESVRPYLKSYYNAIRDYPGVDVTGMDDYASVASADLAPVVLREGGDANLGKVAPNRVSVISRLFGDGPERQAIVKHGFNRMPVKTQKRVLAQMLRGIQDLDVRRFVVESVPVDVMRVFVGSKFSPEALAGDEAVLAKLFAVPVDHAVLPAQIRVVDAIATAGQSVAPLAAEVPAAGSEVAGRPLEDAAAVVAGEDRHKNNGTPNPMRAGRPGSITDEKPAAAAPGASTAADPDGGKREPSQNPMAAAADALIAAANAMKAAVEPKTETTEPDPRKGDRFTDADGKTWEVWSQRGGRVEAFPVVDGKMKVNNRDGQFWSVTASAKERFPDARTDFNPVAKKKAGPTPQVASPGQLKTFIGIAADSIKDLRKVDVERVLTSNPIIYQASIAAHIRESRPDLAQEVDDVLAEQESAGAAGEPDSNPVLALLEKYDEGAEGFETVSDLADRADELAGETGNEGLERAVQSYRDAVDEDYREWGGRDDGDAIEAGFIAAIRAVGVQSTGEAQNVPSANTDLERDSGEPAAPAPGNAAALPDGPGGADAGARGRGEGTRSAGRGFSNHSGVRPDSPSAIGERGNQPVYPTEQSALPSELAPGVDDRERGDLFGGGGVQPEAIADADVADTARKGAADAVAKRAAQRRAESVAQAPGLENIRESLSFLLPGQQEDVHFAEERFARGAGVMFTNGTGTGKTYTGLGVVKRFQRRGITDTLIIVPSDKIADDWVQSGKNLSLDMHQLTGTNDNGGTKIVVTTYANFYQNAALARRQWALVIADESHMLMRNKDGETTQILQSFRALTRHPGGAWQFQRLALPDLYAKADALDAALFQAEGDLKDAPKDQKLIDARNRVAEERKQLAFDIEAKGKVIREKYKSDPRSKVVMMSATPFAYEKNVDYAEGYLFEYPAESRGGYNSLGGQNAFMAQHFGMSMRYNKLTRADASVDRGLMQRQFNTWLKREKVLSGRMLDIDQDYDRKFVLVDSPVGRQIDEALEYLRGRAWNDKTLGKAEKSAAGDLYKLISEQFDYLTRRFVLEAVKAQEVVPRIREHLALGRKVVVYHDYKTGFQGGNPFDVSTEGRWMSVGTTQASLNAENALFRERFADLLAFEFHRLKPAVSTLTQAFPDAAVYNGDVPAKKRREAIARFNEDGGKTNVLVIQSAASAGISAHDTTGKHPRVEFNLGLPTQPTTAIQQEGRIYRVGQKSNAMFRYLNTGTSWERQAFATTIAQRASAAENLALGEQARALLDAFVNGFENSDNYRAGEAEEGTGGREADRAAMQAISEYDRAKSFYFATQKKTSRNKSAEGRDYFATPEPIGLKLVEFLNLRAGDEVLEPSAGHGAIARWIPENLGRTAIEPSGELVSRLAMGFGGKVINGTFEEHHAVNKYDGIAMNPPFGVGGKTAFEHIEKALGHLREGGRIAAIVPTGPSADARLEKMLYGQDEKGKDRHPGVYLIADIKLPSVTFERAGTGVSTRIIVLQRGGTDSNQVQRDFSDAETINDLFDRIENVELGLRPPKAANAPAPSEAAALLSGRDGRLPSAPAKEGSVSATVQAAADEGGFKLTESKHIHTGDTVYTASLTTRVERERYNALNALAKKEGGYYSKYQNRATGAVAGFVFKSAAARSSFVRAAAEDGNLASEPGSAQYVVDEVSGTETREAVGAREPPPEQGDLFAAAPVPGTKIWGVESWRFEPRRKGTLRIGFDRLDTAKKAANAFAALRKNPRERFQVIVTDDKFIPIAAMDLFAGALGQTSVYPEVVAKEVYQTPGARHVWVAHNHPSGVAVESLADSRLTKSLGNLLSPDLGVTLQGSFVIAGTKALHLDRNGDPVGSAYPIPPSARTVEVPIMERTITRTGKVGDSLTSPTASQNFLRNLAPKESGFLMLDSQHRVTGWLPMSIADMQKLRTGDVRSGAGKLFADLGRMNPGAMIGYTPSPASDFERGVANVGAAVGALDIKMLDGFTKQSNGLLRSMAERGEMLSAPAFFSRAKPVTYTTTADGRPVLAGNGVEITDPAYWQQTFGSKVYTSKIVDPEVGHVGFVTLGWQEGRVAQLMHIEIAEEHRGKGYAERAVQSILQHNGGADLHVMSILPEARGFWTKIGTDPFETETGEDGILTEAAYDAARNGEGATRESGEAALRQDAQRGDAGESQAPRFRREGGRQALGFPEAEVRRLIAPIRKSWNNGPRVEVVGSMQDPRVPEAMRRLDAEQREGGAKGEPEGFIHGGTVYLVASALNSPYAVYRTLFHESLGHYGLRGTFGPEFGRVLEDVDRAMPERVAAKMREYGLKPSQRMQAVEEVLAELAQTRPNAGLVKRAIAAIRRFLRELGIDLKLSDNDVIVNFILPARAFVEGRGEGAAVGSAAPAFGRPSAPWYSDLSRALEKATMNAAPAKGWKDYLKGLTAKGVKADEIEWSGINDWLDMMGDGARGAREIEKAEGADSPFTKLWNGANPQKVTKAQVLDYLADNGVKVTETVLGQEGKTREKDRITVELDALGFDWTQTEPDGEIRLIRRADRRVFDYDTGADGFLNADNDEELDNEKAVELGKQLDVLIGHGGDYTDELVPGDTRYSQYVLPGGQNYRELLLTLPNPYTPTGLEMPYDTLDHHDDRAAAQKQADEANARPRRRGERRGEWRVVDRGADGDGGRYAVQEFYPETKAKRADFRSGHFDQPNILAHVRFNERTDAEGKRVLFIEEIQSDWAQKGKREGFAAGSRLEDALTPDERELQALNARTWQDAEQALSDAELKRAAELQGRVGVSLQEKARRFSSKIPTAPFVGKTEAWVALALKRMIRYAAEHEFDRVAFTTGKQQADRYGLDKTAKSIEVIPRIHAGTGERTRSVTIELLNGGEITLGVNANGIVDNVNGNISGQHVEGKHLSDVIGKEMAERVMASEKATFSGEDLKVGGKGMMYFYDKIVPNVANDVLKKLGGGRVGEVRMNVAPESEGKYGLGPFDPDSARIVQRGSVFQVLAENPQSGVEQVRGGNFDSREAAQAFLDTGAVASREQPGFDLTDALRERALGGMPMFSRQPQQLPKLAGDVSTRPLPVVWFRGQSGERAHGDPFQSTAGGRLPSFADLRDVAVRYAEQDSAGVYSGKGVPKGSKANVIETRIDPADVLDLRKYQVGAQREGVASGITYPDALRMLSDMGLTQVAARDALQVVKPVWSRKYSFGWDAAEGLVDSRSRVVASMATLFEELYGIGVLPESVRAVAFVGSLGDSSITPPNGAPWSEDVTYLELRPFAPEAISRSPMFSRSVREEGFPADIGEPIVTLPGQYVAANLKSHVDYAAAKAGDVDAAVRYVKDMVKPENLEEARRRFGADVVFVAPMAQEASGLNAIPDAMAAHYAQALGAHMDTEIVQTNRAFHTGAERLERMLSRPVFAGDVKAGARYVLVDDVLTMGGTLAELADHIRAGGGKVAGVAVLASASKTGRLSPSATSTARLERRFGNEIRSLFRIAPSALTADEALYLEGVRTPEELHRNATAAAEARARRLAAEGLSEPEAGVDGPAKGPAAPDGAFSRGATFTDLSGAAREGLGNLLTSQRTFNRWWHRAVGTQFHKAQVDPHFRRVFNIGQDYLTDTSRFAMIAEAEAPNLLLRMEGVKDVWKRGISNADREKLAGPIFEGTLEERTFTDEELRTIYGLNDRQVGYYHEFRAATDRSLEEMAKSTLAKMARAVGVNMPGVVAMRGLSFEEFHTEVLALVRRRAEFLAQRAEDAEGSTKALMQAQAAEAKKQGAQLSKLYNQVEKLKSKGYAPLMRFGEYTVYVTEQRSPFEEPEQVFFGMYETQAEANRAAKALREEYPDSEVTQGVLSKEAYRVFQGLSPDTLEIFAKAAGLDKEPVFQEYLRLAVNNRSAMKRLMKRKGVPGFSQDATRVLAAFVTSNARLTSSNYHLGEMQAAVEAIPKEKGDVKDEATNLWKYLIDPQEEAGALRGFLFFQYLGGSIASALVNATQPVTMTAPYLAKYASPAKVAAELGKATMEAAKNKVGDDVRAAYARAVEEGLVAPHEIYQLMAQARGKAAGATNLHRAMKVWGSFFSLAEAFNRRATFLAAYRIGRANGVADAYGFARQAVHETQGLYNKGNRPNWARGAVGATIFTFKQFSISYIEFLKRLHDTNQTAFWMALAILVLAAGLEGLPFAEDIEDMLDTLGQWLGHNTNTKKWLRERAADVLGQGGAEFVLHGFSALPGVPLDVSIRMGMHNLIPGTALLKPSETDKTRDVAEFFGPLGGLAQSAGRGVEAIAKGDPLGAARAVLPTALANLVKGAEMWEKGYYTDTKGRKVLDTTGGEAVLKAAGFQPSSVAGESRRIGMVKQDIDLRKKIEAGIADRWARGVVDKRPELIDQARKELAEWNRKNPEAKIILKPEQIRRRVAEAMKTRADRFAKTAPPEIRADVQRAIRP